MGTNIPEVITLSSDEEFDYSEVVILDPSPNPPKKSKYSSSFSSNENLSKPQRIFSRVFRILTHGIEIHNYKRLENIFITAFADDNGIEIKHIPDDIKEMLCHDHTNDLQRSYEKFAFYAEIQLLSELIKCGTPVVGKKSPILGPYESNKQTIYIELDEPEMIYQQCTLLIVEHDYITCTNDRDLVLTGTLMQVQENLAEISITWRGKPVITADKLYTIYLKPNSIAYDDLSYGVEAMMYHKNCNERIFGIPRFEKDVEQFYSRRNNEIDKHLNDSKLNEYQKYAIYSILSMSGDFPFILYGPPGTGKTTTLVHTIDYIFRKNIKENPKILVCTPSNAAADNFALLLMKANIIPKSLILRLMSPRAEYDDLDPIIKEIVLYDDKGFFIPDDVKKIKLYSVIISTIGSCSRIKGCAEFTHIFVDEAGQATEPDNWIPISCFAQNMNTKIILAGDPQQLGPVLIDQVLENPQYKFDQSLLVRLSEMDVYKNDERLMVQLRYNYRSHASIVMMASALFYEDTLVPQNPVDSDAFVNSEILAGSRFPIVFHSVNGEETGKQTFYNLKEITVVERYVKNLMLSAKPKMEPKDIGIVSPYKGQANKLRQKLKKYSDITIDTVEKFQGSERKVIIMTTTRTRSIGFLRDRRRTNTAITRARQLLIIVGNANLLSVDPVWNELIECFKANNCFISEEEYVKMPRRDSDGIVF